MKDDHVHDPHKKQSTTNTAVKFPVNDNSSTLYKCNSCAHVSPSTDDLKVHKTAQHEADKPQPVLEYFHSCITCKYQTNDYNDLNEHINKEHRHDITSFKCCGCDNVFQTKLDLELHMKMKHEALKTPQEKIHFVCTTCKFSCESESALEKHTSELHDHETFKCNLCQRNISKESDLTNHTCIASKDIKCEQCDYRANNVSDIVTHILSTHCNKTEIECAHCEFKAIDKEGMKNHIETEHWELSFMAHIVSQLTNVTENFESFKKELTNILNVIIEDHNVIKQELFIHRQDNHKQADKIKKIDEGISTLTNMISNSSNEAPGPSSTSRSSDSSTASPTPNQISSDNLNEATSKHTTKVCMIGDSIGSNIDIKVIGNTMDKNVIAAKAYSPNVNDEENNAKQKLD